MEHLFSITPPHCPVQSLLEWQETALPTLIGLGGQLRPRYLIGLMQHNIIVKQVAGMLQYCYQLTWLSGLFILLVPLPPPIHTKHGQYGT